MLEAIFEIDVLLIFSDARNRASRTFSCVRHPLDIVIASEHATSGL